MTPNHRKLSGWGCVRIVFGTFGLTRLRYSLPFTSSYQLFLRYSVLHLDNSNHQKPPEFTRKREKRSTGDSQRLLHPSDMSPWTQRVPKNIGILRRKNTEVREKNARKEKQKYAGVKKPSTKREESKPQSRRKRKPITRNNWAYISSWFLDFSKTFLLKLRHSQEKVLISTGVFIQWVSLSYGCRNKRQKLLYLS